MGRILFEPHRLQLREELADQAGVHEVLQAGWSYPDRQGDGAHGCGLRGARARLHQKPYAGGAGRRRDQGVVLGRPRSTPDDLVACVVRERMEGKTAYAIARDLNQDAVSTAQGARARSQASMSLSSNRAAFVPGPLTDGGTRRRTPPGGRLRWWTSRLRLVMRRSWVRFPRRL